MLRFRTEACAQSGHPEFTVLMDASAVPAGDMLLDHLQNTVAAGQRFAPGHAMRFGSAVLRVIDRGDGTLGLEERTGPGSWAEQVQRCLEHFRYQILAGGQLGLFEELEFPSDDAVVQFQHCGLAGPVVTLFRKPQADPAHSGWYVLCAEEHEHGEWTQSDLFEFTESTPFLTPFLALPAGLTLQVATPGLGSAGKVSAHVWRDDDQFLTADDGAVFDAPLSAVETALAELRRSRPIARAIVKIDDHTYRTGVVPGFEHREFTVRFAERPIVPGAASVVLDYLQSAVADGTRFEPGQTISVGWAPLRVIARDDGTLGLEEQLDADNWAEQIDNTVRDTWFQKEVAASLGLAEQLAFPAKQQRAEIARCVSDDAPAKLVLRRRVRDAPDSSGWSVSCGAPHAHDDWTSHTLFELAAAMPFAVQFLALPDNVTVVIESPDTAESNRIRSQVSFHERQLVPETDSYLDAVNR